MPAGDGVRLVRDVLIPMRDGTTLAADLYVPDGPAGGSDLPEQPLPVVMDYIPYRKDEVDPRAMRHYLELPRNGYIVARVDIRGTGGSGGDAIDEYVAGEQVDGYDAIEWIAAQPWCDGHVNMMGISYGGFTALQVATLQPPHLTSIIPVDFTDDRYTDDCHYRGGLLRMYYDLGWYGTRMIAWNAMPTDAIVSAEGARADVEDRVAEVAAVPPGVAASPGRRAVLAPGVGGGRGRPDHLPGVPHRRVARRLSEPAVAALRTTRRSSPAADRSVGSSVPGRRDPGTAHRPPGRGHPLARSLVSRCRQRGDVRAADRRLRPGRRERARIGLETPGRWRAETSWPPTGAAERDLHIGAAWQARREPRRPASTEPRRSPTTRRWERPPACGRAGCRSVCPATSAVTRRARWSTRRLRSMRPLTILGRPRAIIHVASSARVMGVAVSLADVDPDGTSQLVAKGMLNGTRRHSLTDPEPLEPGAVEELAIDVDATAWRFRPGHRVRVAIAAADWPNVWPTPEVGTLTVHHGPARPTRLILPVVPEDGDATPPTFAASPVVARHGAAFEPPATWAVSEDALTGRMAVEGPAPDGARHAARKRVSSATPAACARWTRGTPRMPLRAAGTAVRVRSTATR